MQGNAAQPNLASVREAGEELDVRRIDSPIPAPFAFEIPGDFSRVAHNDVPYGLLLTVNCARKPCDIDSDLMDEA